MEAVPHQQKSQKTEQPDGERNCQTGRKLKSSSEF